jgi:hypothetical protein
MALFGHAALVAACLLLGDERTSLRRGPRSGFDPQRTSRNCRLPILAEHRARGFHLKLLTNLIMFRWLEGIGMLREIMPRGRDMEAVFVDTIVNRPCNLGH